MRYAVTNAQMVAVSADYSNVIECWLTKSLRTMAACEQHQINLQNEKNSRKRSRYSSLVVWVVPVADLKAPRIFSQYIYTKQGKNPE